MRVNNVLVVGSLMGLMISLPSIAQSKRKICPQPTMAESALSDSELTHKLSSRELIRKSPGMTRTQIEQFLFEYDKFPQDLKQEMNKEGASIHLLSGEGVTVDDSWGSSMFTKDGRDWSKVPGSGGSVYSYPKNPTRIVVNHLYDRHGSINLVLHEHAHTLDHLYSEKDVSDSAGWKNLHNDPDNQNVMRGLCGYYCITDVRESFAELFAYYHSCETTKQHLAEVLPSVATFIKNLTSVKVYTGRSKPRNRDEIQRPQLRDNGLVRDHRNQAPQEAPRRRRSIGAFFKKLAEDIEELVDPNHD